MKHSLNNAVLLLLLAVPLRASPMTRARYLMGTVCEITAEGPRAAEGISAAFDAIARLDNVLSLYKPQSELSRLNRTAGLSPVPVSAPLWEALSSALKAARETGGSFDPTLRPSGYRLIGMDSASKTVRYLAEGILIDLGGIGKGIAIDDAVLALRESGISSALINFGGQIYALGAPAGHSGWTVRIGKKDLLELRDASVATSGNSERPGHIVSTRTGRPMTVGEPVSVVSRSAAAADAWATALFSRNTTTAPAYSDCAFRSGRRSWRTPACAHYLTHKSNSTKGK